MEHIFNPNTQKAEAGGSLSLRPACSIEQVLEQSDLGSEGNHVIRKAGEDKIK